MNKLLVVCGATASGKTSLAVECAKRLQGEIVSCDAYLIYRGLNIGTAKPTMEERQGISHHMIDIADPKDSFSVSDYENGAVATIEDILARGKTPILCGGTGFYMNSILFRHAYGHAPASEEFRRKYEEFAEKEGRQALHDRLKAVDPESAQKLHYNDVKRVIRALEIFELTGKKKSEQSDGDVARYPFQAFAIDYPREVLYERINLRVDEMLKNGLVEEVKGLLESGVSEKAQSMQGIGYKEVVDYLKNDINESTMRDIIAQNTRNYAKRQLTFFKHTQNLHWIKPTRDAVDKVLEIYEN